MVLDDGSPSTPVALLASDGPSVAPAHATDEPNAPPAFRSDRPRC
jgi:hypothetical protein